MRRAAVTFVLLIAGAPAAGAFPPYRSSDAGTADQWVLEPRVGARVAREGEEDTVTLQSLRLNLGLPFRLEIPSELEFDAEEGEVADAAIGVHDARPEVAEDVLTASALGELVLDRFRPGLEVAAARLLGDAGETSAVAGAGLIVALGPVDVRGGVHVGLSEAAADVAASLWVTTAIPVR